MRLYFRPLPAFTIATAILFAILIGLGVWQVERLHWKLGLIAEVNGNLHAPAITLSRALAMEPDKAQYHRVVLVGRFDHDSEAYAFATDPDGGPVFHVLTPFLTLDGHTLLVDRGLVPQRLRDPKTRPKGQFPGEEVLTGVWRIPDGPNWFTPPPDIAHRIWYSRDVKAIAVADHIRLAAPVVIEADATANPGGWPRGGQTVVDFPNNHLQYAITWFALAAGLLAIYLAYHRSKGRLGWRA